jgi:DNA invertase Pin-like site-specific DNA recombinase
MEKTTLKAVGYRRVSMREQVDGHSLDAQEKNIRDYTANQGWKLIEIYTDAGISAKKDSHRPSLERLIADAEAGKFDVIVVDKIDRFYRHLAGLLTALDHLRSIGVSFASVQERLDFTSPWGKLMLTVLGILAEIYLDNLRQETIKGKRQRAREGLWNGLPPFGYCRGLCAECKEPNGKDYCPEYGKPNKMDGKHLMLHPIDSKIVKMVFEWYLEGDMSDALIAERLNGFSLTLSDGNEITPREQGHPGKSEPGPFTRDVVRDMLKRIFYTGKLPYKCSAGLGARRTKRSEQGQAELHDGKHPPIITEEEYQKTQELRATLGRHCRSKGGMPAQIYPLAGLLHCGYCGKPMRGVSSTGIRYYRDASRIEKTCDCPQVSVRADEIEGSLVKILQEIVDYSLSYGEIRTSNANLQKAETRYERAKELYMQDEMTREAFQDEKERYEKAQKSLQYANPNAIIALCSSLQPGFKGWESTLPIERKKLLRTAVRAAYLRGHALVGLTPTDVFMPLAQEKLCNCGEGGIRTRG